MAATRDEAVEAVLERIVSDAKAGVSGVAIRDLAEAWAWLTSPHQGHGSPGRTS